MWLIFFNRKISISETVFTAFRILKAGKIVMENGSDVEERRKKNKIINSKLALFLDKSFTVCMY